MKILSPFISTFAAIAFASLPLLAQDAEKDTPGIDFTVRVISTLEIPDFGTSSRSVTEEEAKSHGLVAECGFIIESVKENGTAASLGLKAKDIVTHIAGRPVKNSLVSSLDQYIANLFFNDEEIKVSWLREGDASSAIAKLTNKKNAGAEMPGRENPFAVEPFSDFLATVDAENITTIQVGNGHKVRLNNDTLSILTPDGVTIFSKENFSIDKHIDEVPAKYREIVKLFGNLKVSREFGEIPIDLMKKKRAAMEEQRAKESP